MIFKIHSKCNIKAKYELSIQKLAEKHVLYKFLGQMVPEIGFGQNLQYGRRSPS